MKKARWGFEWFGAPSNPTARCVTLRRFSFLILPYQPWPGNVYFRSPRAERIKLAKVFETSSQKSDIKFLLAPPTRTPSVRGKRRERRLVGGGQSERIQGSLSRTAVGQAGVEDLGPGPWSLRVCLTSPGLNNRAPLLFVGSKVVRYA